MVATTIVLGVFLTAASAGLVYYGLARGFRDEWRRFSQDQRRRGIAAGVVCAVLLIASMVVVVVAPWGRITLLYVILTFAGLQIALLLASATAQVVRRRTAKPPGD